MFTVVSQVMNEWKCKKKLDRMVNRVKPWFMVDGLAHGSRIMVLFMVLLMVWFMVQFIVWFLVHSS